MEASAATIYRIMRYWSNYHPAGVSRNAHRDWSGTPRSVRRRWEASANRGPRYGPLRTHVSATQDTMSTPRAGACASVACECVRVRVSARTLLRLRPTPTRRNRQIVDGGGAARRHGSRVRRGTDPERAGASS